MVAEADGTDRVRKPINTRGQRCIIKIPASPVEQYILVEPDDRRFMLDLPAGTDIIRLTPKPSEDKL